MALTLWAVDPNRIRRGHLVPDGECTLVLRDADVGSWSVSTQHDDLAAQVRDGWRIVIQDDGVVLGSGPLTAIEPDLADNTIIFTGLTDLVHVRDRNVFPVPTSPAEQQTAAAYYVRTGPAETIIRNMIHENAAGGALADRRVAGLVAPTSLGRGSTVRTNLRFKNLLEESRALARVGGVTFDVTQEATGDLALRFRVPQDRSRAIRFSDAHGGVTDGGYALHAPTVTTVFVAGQGEGTARTIIERSRATTWGRRIEEFKDQRDTDEAAQLEQSATETLDDGAASASASLTVEEAEGRRYGVDFHLGDIVTAQMKGFDIAEPVRSVTLEWDGYGRTASLVLGDHDQADDQKPAWVSKIKNLDARVRGMETG